MDCFHCEKRILASLSRILSSLYIFLIFFFCRFHSLKRLLNSYSRLFNQAFRLDFRNYPERILKLFLIEALRETELA